MKKKVTQNGVRMFLCGRSVRMTVKSLATAILICQALVLMYGKATAQIAAPVKKLRIDLAAAQGLHASDVFDEVNYIPLETTSKSIFGEISQMEVTDEYFIIYDSDTKAILIFFRDGRFHCKINIKNPLSMFFLDGMKKEISFRAGNGLDFYDYNGKKIRSELLKRNDLTAAYIYLSGDIKAVALYAVSERFLPDTLLHEVVLMKKGTVYARFLPYNMKKEPVQSEDIEPMGRNPFFRTAVDSCFNYGRSYDYTIYEVSPQNLRKKYTFTFPLANSISSDFSTDTLLKGKRREYFIKHRTKISSITHTYQFGNSLFFKPWNWNDRGNSYIYNLQSGNLASVRNIKADKLSYQLPLTDLAADVGFFNHNFLAADRTCIYSSLSSDMLIRSARGHSSGNIQYDRRLETYLKQADRKDNPVIVQIRPKRDF